jgi:hypothetical protein
LGKIFKTVCIYIRERVHRLVLALPLGSSKNYEFVKPGSGIERFKDPNANTCGKKEKMLAGAGGERLGSVRAVVNR